MEYYLIVDNTVVGPMTADQLVCYHLTKESSVSTDGMNWRPLYTYPELVERMRNSPSAPMSALESKRILCGILALLVGTLGIQYFVIGKTTAGILTIVLSIVTCGLWGIVMFIQGILMLTMSDEDFERKYVASPATYPIF